MNHRFTRLVKPLRDGLHDFCGAWRRCNSLEWNDHSASLRLALHLKNRTLHPVQLRFLGSITDLVFRWGEAYCETTPYGTGKVARYYLAETTQKSVMLPVSPELGRPEHHEWRWASFAQAAKLLPPRLQPILPWTRQQLRA